MDTLRRHPGPTAVAFFLAGDIAAALLTPGGDMYAPIPGGLLALILAVALYIGLRRQGSRSN